MKNNYLNLFSMLSLFLFGLFSVDGFAQCPLPDCDEPGDLEMTIEVIKDPAVCNLGGEVEVTITNTSNDYPFNITSLLEFCLDEAGESDILLTDFSSNNIYLNLVSPANSPYVQIEYTGQPLLPGQSIEFSIFIRGACELMDQLANGNTAEFINNQITGFFEYVNAAPVISPVYCEATSSESFDVDYLLIALEECNDVTEANIGDPFIMSVQAAVEGEYCRKGFEVCVEVDPTIDISNFSAQVFTVFGQATIFGLTINGNTACFRVGGTTPFPPQPYCNPTFPGQLGDISIYLYNMVPTTCDNPLPVTIYTNTCNDDLLDNTCPAPIPHQSSTTCFVNIPLGSPEVSINSFMNSNDRLDFCNEPATIHHTITCQTGNSSDNAFNLFFESNHYSYMNVSGITYNGTPLSVANFGTFNATNGNGSPVIVLSGNDIDINFSNLNSSVLGTEDLDGDGIFAELSTGNSIDIGIIVDSDCPFDGDECLSNLNTTLYQGRITYTNQCNTFTETDTDSRFLHIGGNQAFFDPLPGPIVESPFTVNFCWDESSWSLPDINDPDLDLGPLTVTFTHMVDLNPLVNFDIVALRYEGEDGKTIRLEKNKNSKPGFPSFTFYQMPTNHCMDLIIEYDCPPGGGLFDIAIDIQAVGTWANCPDCEVMLGCASAMVLVSCPCDPMQADCDGCEYVSTSDMTIERVVVGGGTNSGAAYACDEIIVTLSGTIGAGYNGDLYACLGNWSNEFGFFNINSVSYNLSNGTNGSMTAQAPFNSNYGVDFDVYAVNVNILSPVTVTVTISATVDQTMTNALAAGVHPLAVFGSLGEFTDQTVKKCGLEASFFDIYEVKTNWQQLGTNWDCSEEIKVPFRLRYIGGTGGDDFPGEDRPYNQMSGNLDLSISNPNFTILGIEEGGNFYPGTSFTMIESILDPPADKIGSPGTSQDFHILVQATCDAPGSASITVSGTLEEDIAYGACLSSSPFTKNVSFSFNNGGLVANALNTPINTYQRCVELSTEVYATGDPSEDVWIQFEYDPDIIESITPVGGPIGTVTTSGTNPVVWSMIIPGGVQVTPETVNTFEVCFNNACDAQPVSLPFYVGKVCSPAPVPDPPVPSTNPGSCFLDSDVFNISFEESGLDMDVNQCNELTNDFCETIYYSVSINNPGGGNTSDLLFGLELPDGFEVTELYYDYPSAVVNDCNNGSCAGGTAINALISDLLGGGIDLGATGILPGNGNNINEGELPGIQSGVNAAQRRINFCVGISATCEADASADDLVFYSSGRRPCGSEIFIENNQFSDVLGEWYIEVDATMTFIEYDLNCESGTGIATFEIDWPNGMMLPPGQTFYANVLTSGNIQVPGMPINIVPNGDPQTININFTFSPDEACIGDGAIGLLLYTKAVLHCGPTVCEINEFVTSASANIEFNEGWVSVSNLEVEQDLCPDYGPEEGIISFHLENMSAPAGTPVTITYHCDENGDGIPDGPPFASQNINLSPPNTSMNVSLLIDEATFWAACPSGSITAQLNFSSKDCICVRGSLTAEVCCECPDYQFNYTFLGGNAYEFTVAPQTYISLLYCWYDENGDLVFFNTLDNPVIIDFDDYGGYVPDEMCVRIESDFIDCDSTKSRSVVTDPPCSEKFCRPLDSCYADIDFDYAVLGTGLGTATVELTGTVYTNMNPYTISWYVNGDFVGTGSPLVVDINSGTVEICMVVSGVYQDMECVFKTCKTIEIETDCEGLTADYNYQLTGPVEGGSIFTGSAMFSDPNAQHEWYIAYSDESCGLGTPYGMATGPDITLFLPACNFFIVVHRVVIGDCEACYARCFWVCEGRSAREDDDLGNFDCDLLTRYEWPILRFNPDNPIGFGQDGSDKLLDASILVHPNPVRSEATISWSLEGVKELVVHDFTGKQVNTVPLDGEQQQYLFSTNGLSQGIYFVRIQNADGAFLVKRFEIMQ